MLQISVYPCRMCVLLLYASWLSTSADLSKFLKSLSLSRLISPHCSLHEMRWKERQQNYLCRGKLRFHPEKSPNLKNSEENAIEKDCFPIAICGNSFQKWSSEGTCLQEPGWECITLTLCNWRAEAIFACLCHIDKIQGETCFLCLLCIM